MTEPDPLLERLDEILVGYGLDGATEWRTKFKAELRQLMADVAIEYYDAGRGMLHGVSGKRQREEIRQRFGVGVEEKAK